MSQLALCPLLKRLWVIVALLAFGSHLLTAQDDPAAQAGRLSYTSGSVSIQQAGSPDWIQAAPNFPLAPGDRVFTDANSRAEIQVGESYLRLGENSDVTFVEAASDNISFGVAQGSVRVHAGSFWYGQSLNLDTPNGSVAVAQRGDLRLDVFPSDNATIFTNYAPEVAISGAGGFNQRIGDGDCLELTGTNPVSPQWLSLPTEDPLDQWSHERDRQILRSMSFRYVSPEVPGAADLDAYGQWDADTEYGPAWFPAGVSADWAPYHYGRWINHEPWGWVWVEDEPWGYAPFHYGRWAMIHGRWGWIPGPREAHPVWSPALVAFAGGIQVGGAGVSVWFPLGPGEPYRPWYRCSPHYVDWINISNIHESRRIHVERSYVNLVNVTYINRTIGFSAMRHEDFAAGRPAHRLAVSIDIHNLDRPHVLDRPEPRPGPRPFGWAPPVHPVHVRSERPVVINPHGKLIAVQPGARPVEPPVRTPPPFHNMPGRAVIAPPPRARDNHQFAPPPGGDRHDARPPHDGGPGAGAPNRQFSPQPAPAPPPARPMTPPAANPNPQQPPFVRPTQPPNQPPAGRPMPPPPANAQPNPQPPAARPNPAPQQPPFARPNPNPQQPPYVRPNQPPNQPPAGRPAPPQAPNPAPQQPPAFRPSPPPAQPPAPRPTPPPQQQQPPAARPFVPPPPPSRPAPQQPAPRPPAVQPAPRPTPPPPPAGHPAPPPKPDGKDKHPEK